MDGHRIIVLEPDCNAKFRTVKVQHEFLDEMFPQGRCHRTLNGLIHMGQNLGMWMSADREAPFNETASKIVANLSDIYTVRSNREVFGTAVLYEDNGDMTEELWAMVFKVIRSKTKKIAPPEVQEATANYKRESELDPMLAGLRAALPGVSLENYGKLVQ